MPQRAKAPNKQVSFSLTLVENGSTLPQVVKNRVIIPPVPLNFGTVGSWGVGSVCGGGGGGGGGGGVLG